MKHLRKFNTSAERDAYVDETPIIEYPYVHYIAESKSVLYSGPEVDVPLYFENLGALVFSFTSSYEYSRDGYTWTAAVASDSIVSKYTGERIYVRASGLTASSSSGIGKFRITSGTCNVGGNVMSMLYGADYRGKTEITQSYAFYALFESLNSIKSARFLALPATVLSPHCYSSMFNGCGGLIHAPELPATTLAIYCYSSMFQNCKSLAKCPELPATTLVEYCYVRMFMSCESLIDAPVLPATTMANYCYYYMFNSCTSLVNAPELPATTLADACYDSMFYKCDSLSVVSELPAAELADGCYKYMFYQCKSLVRAPEMRAIKLAYNCCSSMFDSCTSLIEAPELPATTLTENCYSYMFRGCASLVNAPELPAITLVKGCYNYMFNGCSALSYIKAMFTTTPGQTYTNTWVAGVATSGTFVKNTSATWTTSGTSGIPSGWSVELQTP